MYEINDQPSKGRYRPIFRTPFSELADWLCLALNAHPGQVIDTDSDVSSRPADSRDRLNS